jgi:hypothetical protein
MDKEKKSGIKNFIRAIVALMIFITLFYLPEIIKEFGGFTTSIVCLGLPILMLLLAHESVKSIKYADDKFVVYTSSITNNSTFFFLKEAVEKVDFHGKNGRYDKYWIKFHLKTGETKQFILPFASKEIFPVIDKLKEKGFTVEYI